ncbi:MAG: hypothetical protein ABI266_04125 [Ginsengibacter sp.]
MKKYFNLVSITTILVMFLFSSCKKEDKINPNQPKITLSSDKFLGKTGQELTVTVTVDAPNGISDFVITKGVNLKTDSSFGVNGVMKIASATGNTFTYQFQYILDPAEVDKLVGFNFRVDDSKGLSSEKDFTLNTTVSGAQLLYTYRWTLKSKIWVKPVPEENIEDCAKDDSYLFNRDSTMSYDYGAVACTFDGFNVYDKWSLSPDEKELSITYHNVFNPAQITTDTYTVTTLTKDKLVMQIYYDLSVFGAGDHELFIFTFEGSPK